MSRSAVIACLCLLLLISGFAMPFSLSAYDDSGTISVKGTVPPKSDNLKLSLDADFASSYSYGKDITYTIKYGTLFQSATAVTIQAQWYKGTIEGAPTPTVEVVKYKNSSGTKAYGGIVPIVDLVNNTITWSIPSLPGELKDQTVQFTVETQDTYTGSKKVFFPISARILAPATTPDQTVHRTYLYEAPSSTATPTPTPTATPESSTATASATTADAEALKVSDISITGISADSATVQVTTTVPIRLSLSYGSAPKLLGNLISEEVEKISHTFVLSNLNKDTKYYFRLSALSDDITTTLADIFSFQTSSDGSLESQSAPESITIGQEGGVLFNSAQTVKGQPSSLVVTSSSVLDFQFVLPNSKEIKSATIMVRSPNVLGISTEESSEYQSQTVLATEVGQSVYVGKIKLPETNGNYEVILRTEDIYGNLAEKKLASVNVVQPMRILDTNGSPIIGASIFLSRYNEKSQTFEVLPNTTTTVKNPVSSDEEGVVKLNIFPGRYTAVISADGYKDQEILFTTDSSGQTDLPQVKMEPALPGLAGAVDRRRAKIQQENAKIRALFRELAGSQSAFRAILLLTTTLLPILTWVSISFRLKIPFWRTPIFLFKRLRSLISNEERIHFIGGILTETDSFEPLQLVYVTLRHPERGEIVRATWTNELGSFHFNDVPYAKNYVVQFQKNGFKKLEEKITAPYSHHHLLFHMQHAPSSLRMKILEIVGYMLRTILGFFLEFLLFFSLLCAILFGYNFGVARMIPLLLVTVLNLILWGYSIHSRDPHRM